MALFFRPNTAFTDELGRLRWSEEELIAQGVLKAPPAPKPGPEYSFPGLTRFTEAAAEGMGLPKDEVRAKASLGWHAAAVASTLAQLPEVAFRVRRGDLPPSAVAGMLERLARVRASLAAQVAGIDAAISDALAGCGIPLPGDEPKAPPEPEPAPAKPKPAPARKPDPAA